jgi:hypothetical protein
MLASSSSEPVRQAHNGGPDERAADELLRLLCSSAARRRERSHQIAYLAAAVAPPALRLAAARQRLSALAIRRLEEAGQSATARTLSDPDRDRLRQAERRNLTQYALSTALCSILEQSGISAVPLKGAILAERLYDDAALRESNDIDLLVTPGDLDRAVQIACERFGYEPPSDILRRDGRPLLHYRLLHPRGAPRVELHWRVHWYEAGSGAAMVQRSQLGDGFRRLAPADELASLLLFYARDGFAGLAPLAAIASWWDRFADQLPPQGLGDFAKEFPELAGALALAGRIATKLAGLPIADSWWPLASSGALRRDPTRLANWRLRGSSEQLSAHAALVDLLLSPRAQRIGPWLRRQVLLPGSELRRRQGNDGSHPSLLAAEARHATSTLTRMIIDVGVNLMAPAC